MIRKLASTFFLFVALFIFLIALSNYLARDGFENTDSYQDTISRSIIDNDREILFAGQKQSKQSHIDKTIYIITPTYARWVQRACLVNLCHTLKQVNNLLWIVVEDSKTKSQHLATFLLACGVDHVHLNVPSVSTPPSFPLSPLKLLSIPSSLLPHWYTPRGVEQRNAGLAWLRLNRHDHSGNGGVVYFADDDNTYSLELFDEIRSTKRVATWPVALVGELPWEGCVTSPMDRSRIKAMWTAIQPNRAFPIDMAAFAFDLDLILTHQSASFHRDWPIGMLETRFLQSLNLTDWRIMEPKASGCQKAGPLCEVRPKEGCCCRHECLPNMTVDHYRCLYASCYQWSHWDTNVAVYYGI